jgi:hypothetical protein
MKSNSFSNSLSLPRLRSTVDNLWNRLHSELAALPPRFEGNPSDEIFKRIIAFHIAVTKAVMGEEYKELAQENKDHYAQYKSNIRNTCPNFNVECVLIPLHSSSPAH